MSGVEHAIGMTWSDLAVDCGEPRLVGEPGSSRGTAINAKDNISDCMWLAICQAKERETTHSERNPSISHAQQTASKAKAGT